MLGLKSVPAAVVLAALLFLLPASVGANGGTLRLSRVTAGPYHVSAWTQPQPPRVGRVDVSVAVMIPDSGEVVPDGQVGVVTRPVNAPGAEVTTTLQRGGGGNALLYHAVVELPSPGRWGVVVKATGPAGAGEAAFEFDVLPMLPFGRIAVIAFVLGMLLAIVWWRRVRRAATRHTMNLVLPALFALGALPAPAMAQTFDPTRYRPSTIEAVVAQDPGRAGMTVNPDVPFRTRTTYTGRFRALAQDSRRLIQAWSAAMAGTDITGAFRRELEVEQAGQRYWLVVQEVLVPQMEGDLRIGEPIDVFVIYIGQVDARHVLLINAFDHDHRNDRRR